MGTRGETMSLRAASSRFVIFLLSAQVVQAQGDPGVTYSPTRICTLEGSTAQMHCRYSHQSSTGMTSSMAESTFWYRKVNDGPPVDLRTEPEYSERVEYQCSEGDCTLTIRDLRLSDSAEYSFRIGAKQQPGVNLSVTGLQIQQSRRDDDSLDLTCHSSCHLPEHPSYIWYWNGEELIGSLSSISVSHNSVDSYSCAVRGYERFHSPSVCIRGNTCIRVTYSHRSICAAQGSSVDIYCMYSSDTTPRSQLWFSPGRRHQWRDQFEPEDLKEDSLYAGRVQVKSTAGRSTLRIANLRESDSAQYQFRFKTNRSQWGSDLPGTTLTVTALRLQVSKAMVHQSHTEAELTCHSSCRPTSYIWFRNGKQIHRTGVSSNKVSVFPDDLISCALEGHGDASPPVYAPKVPSVSVIPSDEMVEGSSVTLSCSSDANPAANYTWYKKHRSSNLQPLSSESQLFFSPIQSSDSGEYYCTAENMLGKRTSQNVFVDVKCHSRSSIMNIIKLILIVLMLIPTLLLSLWIRKKKTLSCKTQSSGEPTEFDFCCEYENDQTIAAARTEDTEQREELM